MRLKFNTFLMVGMIGIFTAGSQFAAKYIEAMWGNENIWWTPMPLALPLNETADAFKVFVGGESLQHHIERGSLQATDTSGRSYRVVAEDIKVRLNNWNREKASRFHHATYLAFAFGSALTFFGIGLGQLIVDRKKAGNAASPTDSAPC